jgi:glycosyltransferase involved in cell wall biosynthesis
VEPDPVVIVTAHNEADALGATLAALARAFPSARVIVADDGSRDGGAEVARAAGVEVVRSEHNLGKGGIATLAAERLLPRAREPNPPVVLLCDADLGETAGELGALVESVRSGAADLAIGAFARRVGGGFGLAVGFSRWATMRRGGVELRAPISGQRAMRGDVLVAVTPFAPRFGMETAMNIDAARAGLRIVEIDLPLAHRATGRSVRGFAHRGRQLVDFLGVYVRRRG